MLFFSSDGTLSDYETTNCFSSPENYEDRVPLLVNDDLLRSHGFGPSLLFHQVVFSHIHTVGVLLAGRDKGNTLSIVVIFGNCAVLQNHTIL